MGSPRAGWRVSVLAHWCRDGCGGEGFGQISPEDVGATIGGPATFLCDYILYIVILVVNGLDVVTILQPPRGGLVVVGRIYYSPSPDGGVLDESVASAVVVAAGHGPSDSTAQTNGPSESRSPTIPRQGNITDGKLNAASGTGPGTCPRHRRERRRGRSR